MKSAFDLFRTTRERIYDLANDMAWEEVNTIPDGFSNSISWNLAHILVTQQLLHYKLSGLEMLLDDVFIEKYRKGSKHESAMSDIDWKKSLDLLVTLAEKLENDYFAGKFVEFQRYPTSYGYELQNIEDAIFFNNIHEALHLGYMMSMRKTLNSQ